ncbi:MAG: DUF3857 and transglutaminase domain-containing protein [Phycisphaerae bacterium]|nr:DUF3857 and transglutaminase domain-containing protein [Phycisphaerae bacterium]
MKRIGFCSIVLFLLAVPAPAQEGNDVLYLQDGRERVGKLIAVTAEGIVFKVNGEAATMTVAKGEVQRVDLSRRRIGDDIRTVDKLDDPVIKRLLAGAPSKHSYPDSGHVVLYSLREYKLGADGSYTLRERRVDKVLLERGKDQATVTRHFKKGEETLKIDFARTINPDGSITPISDAAMDITSVNSRTPEYEKLYQVKFAMKQVKVDSVLDYQCTRHRAQTDPLEPFYASFFFRSREPIIEAELRIIAPRGVELAYKTDRLEDNVEFTKEYTDDGVVYRWVGRNCPRVIPESMMPPRGDLYPRVTVAVKTSWEAIGEAYAKALADAAKPTPAIKAKVQELVAGVDDLEQKARRIFNYFTEGIRQLWVNPNQCGYQPRPVGEVFAKLAGNSTDKAVLLCVMLQEAGLEANVVLCCPQGNGKLVEQVPCIKQLDDALVAVTLPDGRRFLPVDNDSVRFGQMPTEYQGAKGLCITPQGGKLVDVPLNMPDEEMSATNFRMKMTPSGDLIVTKTQTFTGNREIARRGAWKNQKDEELRRDLEVALTALHPKTRLDSYKVENLHDLTKPITFTETYTLRDYAMRAGDDLLVFRLPEIKYSAGVVGKPEREFPLKWWARAKRAVDLTLEIPPGFKVYYAGKDYKADAGVASFKATFATEGDKILYRDTFLQLQTEASSESYDAYKNCLETRARVSKEWIVLERVAE